MPVYKIFKIPMVFSGIYDFLDLVFFFLFNNIRWRRFRFFLRRKNTLMVRGQQ